VLTAFGGAAVLDNETGLVWEQSPSTTTFDWHNAVVHCYRREVGGRKGWWFPTIEELASLVDPLVSPGPTLPAGYPFTNVQSNGYWSATTSASSSGDAWAVGFHLGGVDDGVKSGTIFVWCVRGGKGVEPH
jgi:hypothetical protein